VEYCDVSIDPDHSIETFLKALPRQQQPGEIGHDGNALARFLAVPGGDQVKKLVPKDSVCEIRLRRPGPDRGQAARDPVRDISLAK
jgi:hypothetical protein